ncbi:MAG: protein kinase, partial [Kofleriaceae bacterium]
MDIGPLSGPFGRPDPSLPQVFGRYLLVQRLSRGGMGEIFLAKHGLEGFEKLAVIKKVLPHLAADEQFISRFVDEAQVAIKLSHVNVAQVFEVGRVGDEYFLALEYIDGRDLRRTMALLSHRRQRLPVDLALFIARELANGLAYAHRRTTSDGASLNLVHCDISPPNVLVSFEGETKVIDFGIAKSVMRETASDPKLGFGKFGYMAPEQLIRGGVVDYRTDLYAAGVVLYELLTNSRLYESGREPDYRALAKKVSRGEHPLPSDIDRSLAPYDDLVATALRPKAEDRYQSAAELRDAIQQCLVAVNPTISTDQLGAYMRDLFADEMAAQRELHERVASAHLSDFQEQFHTQTISTVSFALAPMPDATGRVWRMSSGQARARARSQDGTEVIKPRQPALTPGHAQAKLPTPVPGQLVAKPASQSQVKPASQSQVKPSPAFDTMAPPTAAMERLAVDDLEPAAPTIVRRGRFQEDRRRRALIIGLIGAIVIVLGFVAGRLASSHSERPRRRLVATSRDQHAIVVEPIPVDPAQVEPVDPDDIEMTPDEPGDPSKPRAPRPPQRTNPRPNPRQPPVPAVAPFTHE